MFFSVKEPIKIAGKTYIPCVCYTLPRFLEATVNELVNKNKAVIYSEYVYFQNGKVLEKNVKVKSKATKKVTKATVEKEVKEADVTVEAEESEGF